MVIRVNVKQTLQQATNNTDNDTVIISH